MSTGGILDDQIRIKPDTSTRAAIKRGLGLTSSVNSAAPVVALATSELQPKPLKAWDVPREMGKIQAFALEKAGVTMEQFAKLAPIIEGALTPPATVIGDPMPEEQKLVAAVAKNNDAFNAILDTSDKTLSHLGLRKESKPLAMPPLPKEQPAPIVAVQAKPAKVDHLLRATLESAPHLKRDAAKVEAKAYDDAASVLNIKAPEQAHKQLKTKAVQLQPGQKAAHLEEDKVSFKVTREAQPNDAPSPATASKDDVRPEDAELMKIAAQEQKTADREQTAMAPHVNKQPTAAAASKKAASPSLHEKRAKAFVKTSPSEDDVRPEDAELIKIAAEAEDTSADAAPVSPARAIAMAKPAPTKHDVEKKIAEKSADDALALKYMMRQARRQASHQVAPVAKSQEELVSAPIDMTKMSSAQLKAFIAAAAKQPEKKKEPAGVLHPTLIVTKKARAKRGQAAVTNMDTAALMQIVKLAAQNKAEAAKKASEKDSKKTAFQQVDWEGAF